MNKQINQKKVSIDLNIRQANIDVEDSQNIVIIWKRGNKKIDTQVKPISPDRPYAIFNEKFQMKTQLEWDSLRYIFKKKHSELQVHKVEAGVDVLKACADGTSTIIGEADFDLAHYANNPQILQDKLPLNNCDIEDSFIEIHIKTNSKEVLQQAGGGTPGGVSPNGNQNEMPASPGSGYTTNSLKNRLNAQNQLQQIEERTSETGFKEDIDRQDFLYNKEIEDLQSRITDINNIKDLTQKEIQNTLRQNDDIEKNQQIITRRNIEIAKMEQKEDQLAKVLDVIITKEKTLQHILDDDMMKNLNQQTLKEMQDLIKARISQQEKLISTKSKQLDHVYSFDRCRQQAQDEQVQFVNSAPN